MAKQFRSSLPFVLLLLSSNVAVADEPTVDFRRDVLPILSENCFACHGFDEKARQASLRLDTRDGATGETDSGEHAIVPGEPDESELLRRVTSEDADMVMPPVETEKRLSSEQIDILTRWITQGAEYKEHWSFEAPQNVQPPTVENVAHPIDAFIQARLSQENLTPSRKATDATLLRRISLDLIGLPPTVEELDAFHRRGGSRPNQCDSPCGRTIA